MGDGAIRIDSKLDSSGFENGMRKMKKSASSLNKVLSASLIGAIAAVVVKIAAIGASAIKVASDLDKIDKASQKIGVSTTAYQELDYILKQNGTSVEATRGAFRELETNIVDNAEAFDKLGVSLENTDGSMKSKEQVMFDTIRAFEGMENGIEKSRLANELFGKSSEELIPLLNGQEGSMDALKNQAHAMGLVVGEDAVKAGAAFSDALDNLKAVGDSLMKNVIIPLLPLFTKLIDKLRDFLTTNVDTGAIKDAMENIVRWAMVAGDIMFKSGKIIWEILKDVFNAIVSATEGAGDLDTVFGYLGKTFAFFESVAKVVVIGIKMIITNIINLISLIKHSLDILIKFFQGDFAGAGEAMGKAWGSILDIKDSLVDGFKEITTTVKQEMETFTSRGEQHAKEFRKTFGEALSGDGKIVVNPDIEVNLDGVKTDFAPLDDAIKEEIKKLIESHSDGWKLTSGYQSIIKKYGKEQVDAYGDGMGGSFALLDKGAKKLIRKLAKNPAWKESEQYKLLVKKYGKEQVDAYADGMADSEGDLLALIAGILKNVAAVMQKSLQIALKVVKGFIKAFQNTFKAIGSAISFIVDFNPAEIYQKFKDTIDGIEKFFIGGLGDIVNWVEKAVEDFNGFLGRMGESTPQIMTSISNLVKSIIEIVDANKGEWGKQIGDFINLLSITILKEAPKVIGFMLGLFVDMLKVAQNGFKIIAPVLKNAIVSILTLFAKYIPLILDIISEVVTDIVTILLSDSKIVDAFLDTILGIIEVVSKHTPDVLNLFIKLVNQVVKWVRNNLGKIIEIFVKVIFEILDVILSNIPVIITVIIKLIGGIISAILQNLPTIIRLFITLMVNIVSSILDNIPLIITAIITLITNVIASIIQNLPAIISAFISMIPMLLQAITLAIPQIIGGIIQLIISIVLTVIENLPMIVEAFVMMIPMIIMAIYNNRHQIAESFMKMGEQVIMGFVDGIVNNAQKMWKRVEKAFSDFAKKVKKFFGIKSPSTMFAEMGGYLVEGMENGINEEGKHLYENVEGTFDKFKDNVEDNLTANSSINIGANTSAFDSVLTGLQDNNLGLNAAINNTASQTFVINNVMNGTLNVDGRKIAEIVFRNMDSVTRGAYGY